MKKLNKVVAAALAVTVAVSFAATLAACNSTGGKEPQFTYKLVDDDAYSKQSYYRLTACKLPDGFSGEVEIPSTYEGKPVQELVYYSRSAGGTGQSVIYSEGELGDVTIKIPNTVRYISEYVFPLRSSSMKINFVDYGKVSESNYCSVEWFKYFGHDEHNIPNHTLYISAPIECESLTEINIPKGTFFEYGVAKQCTALADVNFEGNLAKGANVSFNGCSALTSLNVPATPDGILTLSDCQKIQTVKCGNGFKEVDWGSIDTHTDESGVTYKTDLKYIILPEGVKKVVCPPTDVDKDFAPSCKFNDFAGLFFNVNNSSDFGKDYGVQFKFNLARQDGDPRIAHSNSDVPGYAYYFSDTQISGAWHYVNEVPTKW